MVTRRDFERFEFQEMVEKGLLDFVNRSDTRKQLFEGFRWCLEIIQKGLLIGMLVPVPTCHLSLSKMICAQLRMFLENQEEF